MEECAKAQCVWCGGTATYDANGSDADQVDPVPIFLERQYVPNCGEMAGWSHKCNYGGYFSCDAHPIHALLETEKERAV